MQLNLLARLCNYTQEHDTTLHVAAKWGKDEVAESLLNFGADFTLKNRVSNTKKYLCIQLLNSVLR